MLNKRHTQSGRHRRPSRRFSLIAAAVSAAVVGATVFALAPTAQATLGFEIQSLDGSGNNAANPTRGKSNTQYIRVGPTRYADGHSQMVAGPNARNISNRVFNDIEQNVFSDHRVTQWGWTWGQFLDHTFGLAQGGTETANIPFNSADPLEDFTNTLGFIPFTRNAAAAGTGVTNARQQINTVSSYIDAWAVYGGTTQRLEWMRDGPFDGTMSNNAATLMLQGGYLPRRTARGDASAAPEMAVDGRLLTNPTNAAVAGDVRANENMALTATHTLFAREHNRIVAALPTALSAEDRFQIARRVVIAEQQFITYNEFLPAMGVPLPAYTGYNATVNPSLSQEFAVVGYRNHSSIHGEFEFTTEVSRYTQAELDAFEAQGVEVVVEGDTVDIEVPLNVAFFNPELLRSLEIGPFLRGLTEQQYKNDEQIDNQLRSVLFQVPTQTNPACDPTLPECFTGVVDLGAIDVERGRDHGLGTYNQLRQAYGLPARTSFTAITGESTDQFPAGSGINNRNSLDVISLSDIEGGPVAVGDDGATTEVRRSTVAARLRAIYGNVNNVDAFVGMMAEPHVTGSEFGELQQAIWRRQFQALRDGDRFYYGNRPELEDIKAQFGIDFRRTLAQVIASNTDFPLSEQNDNVFLVEDDDLPAASCAVIYTVASEWPNNFQVSLRVINTSGTALTSWTLRWQFPAGQRITLLWNGNPSQSGVTTTVTNAHWNGSLAAGATLDGVGFNASFDNATNANPTNITLNNRRCARS